MPGAHADLAADQETQLSQHPHQLAAPLLLEVDLILSTFLCVLVCSSKRIRLFVSVSPNWLSL